MPFDVASFLVGVAAGVLTGGLAGVLHGLESVADLQERVRKVTQDVQRLNEADLWQGTGRQDTKLKLNGLQHDLDEIQEQIRRMYARTSR